jgi:glycosyltransferase involved in cell wall biosynthesis
MSPTGHLYLVDPYVPGPLGVSMALVVAQRTVNSLSRGQVSWLRMRSDDAAREWRRQIDFLFIDADHRYERASSDWRLWAPFVAPGGHVALHDSVAFERGGTGPGSGAIRLLDEIGRAQPEWLLVDRADSLSVLRRAGPPDVPRPNGSQPGPLGAQRHPKLRLLRVADLPRSATAGASGYIFRSSAEIERDGHEVSMWFRESLVPAVVSPGRRRLLVPWVIAGKVVAAQRRGSRFDVVEIHEPSAGVYAVLARLGGWRLPVSAVLSFGLEARGWQAQRNHLRAYGRKPAARSRILVPLTLLSQAQLGLSTAEAVLVPSTADRAHLMKRLRVPGERVSCAFTGVSSRLFEVERTAASDVRVLFLGSWIERKGTIELVAAWRRLARARPAVRLTLAGVGDAERASADVGDTARVEVLAEVGRKELPALLARHDVFVLPSWFEGMPLSMLEAAAAGLPCIVCGVCGNLDVFRPDDPQRDGAMLVPPSDPDALYEALVGLVDDPVLRKTLGHRARERARHFSWSDTAERSVEAYVAANDRRRLSRTT